MKMDFVVSDGVPISRSLACFGSMAAFVIASYSPGVDFVDFGDEPPRPKRRWPVELDSIIAAPLSKPVHLLVHGRDGTVVRRHSTGELAGWSLGC